MLWLFLMRNSWHAFSFQVEAVLQAADLSVLMPGQRYPTYLAQPAPLPPSCPREGVHWPPHDHHNSYMPP
jgi:hypothetical protein